MAERLRAPLPDEIDVATGCVICPLLPKETPLARRQRVRTHCAHGHEFRPASTIICFTDDYPPRRVRRCLVCLGKYTLSEEAELVPDGAT